MSPYDQPPFTSVSPSCWPLVLVLRGQCDVMGLSINSHFKDIIHVMSPYFNFFACHFKHSTLNAVLLGSQGESGYVGKIRAN